MGITSAVNQSVGLRESRSKVSGSRSAPAAHAAERRAPGRQALLVIASSEAVGGQPETAGRPAVSSEPANTNGTRRPDSFRRDDPRSRPDPVGARPRRPRRPAGASGLRIGDPEPADPASDRRLVVERDLEVVSRSPRTRRKPRAEGRRPEASGRALNPDPARSARRARVEARRRACEAAGHGRRDEQPHERLEGAPHASAGRIDPRRAPPAGRASRAASRRGATEQSRATARRARCARPDGAPTDRGRARATRRRTRVPCARSTTRAPGRRHARGAPASGAPHLVAAGAAVARSARRRAGEDRRSARRCDDDRGDQGGQDGSAGGKARHRRAAQPPRTCSARRTSRAR